MNKIIAIALIVIIFTAGFFGLYALISFLNSDSTVMTITFYDAEGTAVYSESTNPSYFPLDFTDTSGAIVDSVEVKVTYKVTSDAGINALTVSTDVTATARVTQVNDKGDVDLVIVNTVTAHRDSTLATNTYILTWTMGQLIPNPDLSDGKLYGWSILFELDLDAVGAQISGGSNLIDTDQKSVAIGIGWQEDPEPTFKIEGTISVD